VSSSHPCQFEVGGTDRHADQIDPRHFSKPSLPISSETDLQLSFASLEQSYKAVTTFLLKNCRHDPGRLPPPDFRLIASGEGLEDLINLLELVILAAFKGANRNIYAKDIQDLPEATQKLIFELIASHSDDDDDEEQQDENAGSEGSSQPASSRGDDRIDLPIGFDADLAREERLLKLVAERKEAQQEKQVYRDQLSDLHSRYTSLQQSFERTQDELKDTKDRLQTLLSGRDPQSSYRSSQPEKDEQIAELEAKLSELEEANEALNRSKEVFRVKAEKSQSLQDDYDEIKQQNASLRNRVNALDKYKQKAEEGRNLEDRNRVLEAKVADLQKQLKESDSSLVSIVELRRTNDEYRQLLSTIEQDRNEQHEMKMRIELQYHTLVAEHRESVDQLARQNATNEELESRLHEYEEGHTPTTTKPRAPESTTLSGYDEDFAQDEAKLSQEFTMVDVDDQNYISEVELRAIMAAMQAQARDAGTSGKSFSIAEEKKLADKIEKTRHTAKQLIQVIDFLAQPRVELVGVKDLDSSLPFKPLPPNIEDDVASVYASANASITSLARSSVTSLALSAAALRKPSAASVRSTNDITNDSTTPRRASRLIPSIWRGRI
jgi:myosin heavy subunit